MKRKSFTLAELATYTQSKLVGNPDYVITNVADLDTAGITDVSFLSNPRYNQAMQRSLAGAIFILPNSKTPEGKNYLIAENPSEAFQKTLEAFHGKTQELTGFADIHPTAVIHPTAKIGNHVTIGPYAVIDKEVEIGNNTFIGSGCYVGPFSKIGSDCVIHPHAVVREKCCLGNRVILQPGAIIGSCGFGYLTNKEGVHTKLNQVGIVSIKDDVEIGANSTIDRARFNVTEIGEGTKLDNLVQIAHGVILGPHNIFAAQSGIAGSASTGKCVIAGGQVAIAGHLHISDGVILAGRSGVTKSLTKPGPYSGMPAKPLAEHNRNGVFVRNLEIYVGQIKDLQKRILDLEAKSRGT